METKEKDRNIPDYSQYRMSRLEARHLYTIEEIVKMSASEMQRIRGIMEKSLPTDIVEKNRKLFNTLFVEDRKNRYIKIEDFSFSSYE